MKHYHHHLPALPWTPISGAFFQLTSNQRFPDISVGKESTCNAGDPGWIWVGKSPGKGVGYSLQYTWVFLVAQLVKNPPAMLETWVGKIPWRTERIPTPVFWPGEFHGLYSWRIPWRVPWGHKETGLSHFHFFSNQFT